MAVPSTRNIVPLLPEAVSGIAANLSGTGSLSATLGAVNTTVAASLSGSGSLSVNVTLLTVVSGTMSGTGSLTVAVSPVVQISASLSGSGSQTVDVTVQTTIAASLSGVGSLSATALSSIESNMSGSGSLSGTLGIVNTAIADAMSGTGAQAAAVTVQTAVASTMSGVGSLSVDVSAQTVIASAMSGTGSMAADVSVGAATVNIEAALSGNGSLSAAVTVTSVSSPTFGGGGAFARPLTRPPITTVEVIVYGSAELYAYGSIQTLDGVIEVAGTGVLHAVARGYATGLGIAYGGGKLEAGGLMFGDGAELLMGTAGGIQPIDWTDFDVTELGLLGIRI